MKNIKKLRIQAEMTQKELATASSTNEKSIKAYEQGQRDINKAEGETLRRIAKALGCSIEEIME